MSKKSNREPEGRHYTREYGYSAELERFFNASSSELGLHGCNWREFSAIGIPSTDVSDMVLGWGKSLVSSPEHYRRVMRALAVMESYAIEVVAARYVTRAESEDQASWRSQLGELRWVAIAVAVEMDRRANERMEPMMRDLDEALLNSDNQDEFAASLEAFGHKVTKGSVDAFATFLRVREATWRAGSGEALAAARSKFRESLGPTNIERLTSDVVSGLANKSKQKGHRSWLQRAEHASREAHEQYERARKYGERPENDRFWVWTGRSSRFAATKPEIAKGVEWALT